VLRDCYSPGGYLVKVVKSTKEGERKVFVAGARVAVTVAESLASCRHHPNLEEQTMPAKGSAEWQGELKSGSGTFTAGDSIGGDYSFKSRFEDGPGANPEQLIAAAHASCFSMALAAALGEAGTPAESVKTDATVTLRFVDGAPTITSIALSTVGSVAGIDQATFQAAAEGAKAGCPVSRALAGVSEITLDASLA
jgi:lipoyl-dependent peroxiredoxin